MTMLDATAAPLGADARAFVLLKSRRRLDLLNPDPQAWTDDDLAAGLSRTMRWGGASQWGHPLSVAQHSLTVLAIREAEGPLTAQEGLRELLHDATEFMLGWDFIAPLKAQLGAPFRQLEAPPGTVTLSLNGRCRTADRDQKVMRKGLHLSRRSKRSTLRFVHDAFHLQTVDPGDDETGWRSDRGWREISEHAALF